MNTMHYLRGEEYQINQSITMRHPTLQDIMDYGEEKYNNAINLFCMKPYDLMVELNDVGMDFRKLSDFDLFLQLIHLPMYQEAIEFFIGICKFELMMNEENGETFLFDPFLEIKIDRYIYGKMRDYVSTLHFRSDKREFNVENDIAVEFLMEEERTKRKRQASKPKKEFDSYLADLISFFCWNNTSGYNIQNVWNLRVYQFYDGLHRLYKTDNYKNTMMGIYTGNVDGSKINMEEISWSSKIKI